MRLLLAAYVLTAGTVLAQIAYPLAPDAWLTALTVGTVLAFAAASLAHSLAIHGPNWTGRLVLIVVPGAFAAEALGVATGVPFGHYTYADRLGPQLLGVPLLVPLAWLMMAYPCLVMARILTRRTRKSPGRATTLGMRTVGTGLVAGAAMAAWDVSLDPQMVAAHNWTWRHPHPGLPGIDAVPLTNLIGWLVVATVLLTVADRWLGQEDHPIGGDIAAAPPAVIVPAALLGWTWIGSLVGNAVFFGRPAVALWGGGLLGAFVVPFLWAVRANPSWEPR